MGRILWIILGLLFIGPSPLAAKPRLLHQLWHTERLRSSLLPANSGWHDVYGLEVPAQAGDVLVIDSQIQLSVDTVSQVGQQFRLLVNDEPVGCRAIEINVNPGSHHLPMRTSAIFVARQDGLCQVRAQASAFHSDGNFRVSIDHADNLSYGTLMVEQYREGEGWSLRSLHQAPQAASRSEQIWGKEPYQQLSVAELTVTGEPLDLLRMSGQVIGQALQGLEMVAGVMTEGGRATSPYAGENVGADNVFAPLGLEGVCSIPDSLPRLLQLRVYGGFRNGFKLYPDGTHLDVLRFSRRKGRELRDWGQLTNPGLSSLPSNEGLRELAAYDLFLEEGEIVRTRGQIQFARPEADLPVTLECQMRLSIRGAERKFLKNLTPTRVAVPLSGTLVYQAPASGFYRLSLQLSGFADVGSVRMRLDADQTQLQYLRYGEASWQR